MDDMNEAARAAFYQAHKDDPEVWGDAEEQEPPPPLITVLYCEICNGVLEPHDGAVTHLLLRLVRPPNPHEGWWRDHPEGARFLCDECYAEHIHPVFGYGAPDYIPRDRARPCEASGDGP